MISTKYHPYLIALCKAPTASERRKLIQAAHPDIIKALCEIVRNLILGNITKEKKILLKFKPHIPTLIKIDRTKGVKKQRKLLSSQSGGSALPFILPVFATIAGGLIQKILNGTK